MIKKLTALFVTMILFIGCGSGGSSSATGKGTYVDSAVDGVNYVCGLQSGVTGDTGKAGGFKYEIGKDCTFSVAGIELSKVPGEKFKFDGVEVKVDEIKVARFLQSLDIDGNATNGITISSNIIKVLEDNNKVTLPKTDRELNDVSNLLRSASVAYNGHAKTKEEAELHMAGFSLTLKADKTEIIEGDSITFEADVKGNANGVQYEWVDLDRNEKSITIDNLTVGEHEIVVKATKDGITLTDSINIKVDSSSEFLVNIQSTNNKYTTSDDILLEAILTGVAVSDPTYTWKDGNTDLGVNTKTLIKKFAVGNHTVTVEVTGNGITKRTSINFNVSDLTDFNITDLTITQNSKALMWVNAAQGTVDKNNNIVCLAIHGDEYNASKGYDDSFNRAKTFCGNMDFAGFTNWRTPTVDELSNFIKDTNSSYIVTKYDRPCTQLLALTDSVSDPLDGVNYRAVTTRFMSTKYFPNIGTVRDHTYSADAKIYDKYNVGLRCVRNIDGSGGEDISGTNISVTISGAKSEYIIGEDVNLTANVSGTSQINSYIWSENGVEIGNSSSISKSDFALGSHTVSLKIETDDVNKTASVSFNIHNAPNLSDFNITSLTSKKDEVIVQKSTNLMWVNESNISKGKCAKIHGNTDDDPDKFATEFANAKTFCSSIDGFAGKTGWRTPTADELRTFIISTINANVLPAYDAHCAKLLALVDSSVNSDSNDSYVTVTTRYNKNGAGTISNAGDLVPNIGLRCVRDNN